MTDEGTDEGIWKALADATRRRILDALRESPRTTGELCALMGRERGLSRFAVMKHLGVLEESGLVLVRREGRLRWNHLNAAPFVELYRRWVSPFAGLPAAAALGLKAYAERDSPGAGAPDKPPAGGGEAV